ncbi:hypothetical protein T10_1847 [Trichinella papuae]|uniref:Uncharacterized protein n=1 Tax=Trichinella papuae TaxID=268474 RepID=A0A0V1MJ72_9BILA|nr:hypothetical protein T10_1847 [Trichinella papuae]
MAGPNINADPAKHGCTVYCVCRGKLMNKSRETKSALIRIHRRKADSKIAQIGTLVGKFVNWKNNLADNGIHSLLHSRIHGNSRGRVVQRNFGDRPLRSGVANMITCCYKKLDAKINN